ncbi:hypothetical protein [Paenibacillus ginsengarvi]|uniref:Pectate lyase superfamily protein domain-containing protein n=1 Tax=Paenibacillus ginsengarvi TaxID=400777 RepID=A0A3B0C532_9BACL|nr:hypothetical protein [Paenibacillus ginsengarvi]RKN79179.1 hypothetical protein D7M11_21090 [Paenibacillus ginsengarvi]
MEKEKPDRKMSRRSVLTTLGLASASAVTGTLLGKDVTFGYGVTDNVYGNEADMRRIADEVVQEYAQQVSAELTDIGAELALRGVNAAKLGLKGDGTDETTALRSAIQYAADRHLTLLIPRWMTVCVDTITITGKQNFGIRCEGWIRRLDQSPTVGSLLKLDSCSGVYMPEIRFDGNGLNNGCVENVAYTVNQEQKHCLVLLNCQDVTIDRFHCLNPCGDGLYISSGSKNMKLGTITGQADAQIGRNLVSIINAQNIRIDYLYSDNIGHYDMPGGFDIEPNASTETVRNVFVNSMNITGGGTNPCSVLGTNNALVENVFLGSVNLVRTNIVLPSSEITSVYISASNVRIGQLSVVNKTAHNISFLTLNKQGLTPKGITILDSYGEGCYRGIQVGFGSNAVEDVHVKATIRNCKHDGIFMGTAKNVKLDIDIDSVGADRFMLNKPAGGGVCNNIYITGNFSNRGTGLKAMIIGDVPANVVNWTLENVDFTGWGNNQRLYGGGFQGTVRKINCRNLTHLTSLPAFEQFKQGDLIWNIGADPEVSYWRRLTNGTGNALNTDWKAY